MKRMKLFPQFWEFVAVCWAGVWGCRVGSDLYSDLRCAVEDIIRDPRSTECRYRSDEPDDGAAPPDEPGSAEDEDAPPLSAPLSLSPRSFAPAAPGLLESESPPCFPAPRPSTCSASKSTRRRKKINVFPLPNNAEKRPGKVVDETPTRSLTPNPTPPTKSSGRVVRLFCFFSHWTQPACSFSNSPVHFDPGHGEGACFLSPR